jgi:hypothetical protein
MEHLSIIQGDTLDAVVTIEKPAELVIDKVRFVCASLNLDEELEEAGSEEEEQETEVDYAFMLTPDKSQALGVGN